MRSPHAHRPTIASIMTDRSEEDLDESPERAITVRTLVRDSFRSVGAQHVLIAALCLAPAFLVSAASPQLFGTEDELQRPLLTLVGVMAIWAAQAGLVYLTVQREIGRAIGAWDALVAMLWQLPSLLVVGVMTTLVTVLGLVLLIAPGIFAWLVLFVVVPAMMIERLGPVSALRRSVDLTHGHRVTIFGAALAVLAVCFSFACLCALCPAGILLITPPEEPRPLSAQIMMMVVSFSARCAVLIALSTLSGVFYARVRRLRETIDAEAIAEELR